MAENIVFQILRSHLMEGELMPGHPHRHPGEPDPGT